MARYKMRQRLISIGEDFTIEDERGNPVYTVDGKVLRIRETFVIEDQQGNEVATIRKAWFTPFRDKFAIDVKDGQDLVAQGDLLDHEYEIRRGGATIAHVSKHWFAFRDTYGIEIAPGEDDGLILAIAVAIDEMVHDPDEGHD